MTTVHHHGGAPIAGTTPFAREIDASMARMMQAMNPPAPTGNPDADFLAMMIPHHAGAVDMARLLLQHGRDPITRQLAEEIIASQTVEIENMQRRLAMLRHPGDSRDANFPALGGLRGP
jgi:uncharacterized protein (DUF305 family)